MRDLLRSAYESLRRDLDPDNPLLACGLRHPHAVKLPPFEAFEMAEAMQDELLRNLGRGPLLD